MGDAERGRDAIMPPLVMFIVGCVKRGGGTLTDDLDYCMNEEVLICIFTWPSEPLLLLYEPKLKQRHHDGSNGKYAGEAPKSGTSISSGHFVFLMVYRMTKRRYERPTTHNEYK